MPRRPAKSSPSLPHSVFFIASFLCFVGLAGGQVAPGMPSFGASDNHEVDSIDLSNNNIVLSVPIMSKSGTMGFQYGAFQNYYMAINPLTGSSWLPSSVTWGPPPHAVLTESMPGTASYSQSSTGALCPDGHTNTTKYYNWIITDSLGTVHPFASTDFSDKTAGGTSCLTGSGFTDHATDGSGYTITVAANGTTTTIYDKSGNAILNTSITDPNGNSISSSGGVFTDSMGLTVLTNTSSNYVGYTNTWTDVNGGSQNVAVSTAAYKLLTNFGCNSITDLNWTAVNINMPSRFTFADSSTLGITYEVTPGNSPDITGRLNVITLRGGGTITYTYGGSNNGIDCTYQNVPTLSRQTNDGTTSYALTHPQIGSTANYQALNTVTDPGGNVTKYTFTGLTSTGLSATYGQVLTMVQVYQSNSTLLKTIKYCYNTNATNCDTAQVTPPITERDTYTTLNGMSSTARVKETYDSYGNLTYRGEYDYSGLVVRELTLTYGSCSASCTGASPTISSVGSNIYNRPGRSVGKLNGNVVAESRNTYDSHGNLLMAYVWNGSAFLSNTTANAYNSNGTPSDTYDLANNHTTYAYSAASYTNCTGCTQYPFATSITKGGLTTNTTYNGVGGVKLTDKDASGNTTTYGYANSSGTADPYWRVMSVTDPLNNEVWKTYPSGSSPDTVNSSFTFNSGNSIQNTTVTTDGYGRKSNVQAQQSPSATNYDTASPVYGWSTNYRTVATSLPCTTTSGSTCATVHTNYYDPLGRLYQGVTNSNETLTHTYTQNDDLVVLSPAPTNENNKQVQKEYDGLGRLTKSCAIGNGSSTACGQNSGSANGVTTSFSYTSAAGSTTTTTTRGSQTRTSTYDALGRVTQKITPEGGTWNYYYDVQAGCPGSVAGHLTIVSDPNGNGTCFYYDTLGRPILASANTTTCRHFYYDNSTGYSGTIPTGISISNSNGRMVEAATDSCSSGTLITDEWFSYDADGHMTDMWEKTPNSGQYYHSTATFAGNGVVTSLQLANPSLYTVTYGLDGEGRWNTLSQGSQNIVTATTYNAAGQPTYIGLTGTTPDQDDYTYDSNTGRMKTFEFVVGNTPSNLTGTLTWNPNGTLNKLAIADGFNSGGTQTCYFNPSSGSGMGYDDWGRLLNDDCGSGGWGQTFSYDQYNNLTKAVISGRSGITFNPGYNSANNQFASGFGASYDSNGNLTNDTFHRYEWNEFSKVKTFDRSGTNCATSGECLVYDALGRVVEMDSGSVKTEYWYTQLGKTAYMNGATITFAHFPAPGGGSATLNGNCGSSCSIYYEHKDWLGSSRIVSAVNGHSVYVDQAYAPYGEIYARFGSTGLRYPMFTGDTEDIVSGTFDTPNREYNSGAQGRWISPDPAGAGWNQYAYATNPNTFIDPTGMNLCVGNIATCFQGSGFRGNPGPGQSAATGSDPFFGSGLFADYNPSIWVGSGQPSQDVPAPDMSSVLAGQFNDPSLIDSILGLPTATGTPSEVIIGGFMFSFDMPNCCTSDGKSVFPLSPADSQVIGNAWSLQVANASGQPLAGNFSVTENITVLASTGSTTPTPPYTWTTNSTGGFVDNIFWAFDAPFNRSSYAMFEQQQNFTINGAGANSFYQYYNYYGGLVFANPSQ